MSGYTIGIDVGGTKVAYGLFDANHKLCAKTRHKSDAALSPEAFFDNIIEAACNFLQEKNLSFSDVRGIGIGLPSYINFEEGYILKTSALTKLKNFHAKAYLTGKLKDFPIVLDNDSHAGALAEYKYGAGKGHKNMLYCPVSTGIASGIVINGRLFRGDYGWAGESGHMIITPGEGVLCGCGNRGCLMSWCSGGMIVKHIQSWISAGEQTSMLDLAGSAEAITTVHLAAAYARGDKLAIRAVEQMAKYMAVWLYNLYALLNINCFVFGGGLLEMGSALFAPIREQFDKYNQNEKPVTFKTAALKADFGIIGAAELLEGALAL